MKTTKTTPSKKAKDFLASPKTKKSAVVSAAKSNIDMMSALGNYTKKYLDKRTSAMSAMMRSRNPTKIKNKINSVYAK